MINQKVVFDLLVPAEQNCFFIIQTQWNTERWSSAWTTCNVSYHHWANWPVFHRNILLKAWEDLKKHLPTSEGGLLLNNCQEYRILLQDLQSHRSCWLCDLRGRPGRGSSWTELWPPCAGCSERPAGPGSAAPSAWCSLCACRWSVCAWWLHSRRDGGGSGGPHPQTARWRCAAAAPTFRWTYSQTPQRRLGPLGKKAPTPTHRHIKGNK